MSRDVCGKGRESRAGKLSVTVTVTPDALLCKVIRSYCVLRLLRALVPFRARLWVPFPGTSSLMLLMRKMQTLLILTLTAAATGSGRPRGTSTVRAIQ